MDNWIMTVFEINPKLDMLSYNADKAANEHARRHGFDTMADVNAVLEFVNLKNAYFNLRVIYNSFIDALSDTESKIIDLLIDGSSVTDIARNLGVQRNTVYRSLKKAFKKCEYVLKALDYSEKNLVKEFMWVQPVAELMQKKAA